MTKNKDIMLSIRNISSWFSQCCIAILIFSSCQTKYARIGKNQRMYTYVSDADGKSSTLKAYEPSRSFSAVIKEKEDYLVVTLDPSIGTKPGIPSFFQESSITPTNRGFKVDPTKTLIEPPSFYFDGIDISKDDKSSINPVFQYSKWSPYLQAISIPVKFRSASEGVLPQVDAGINGALATGYKHSWYTFSSNKNALGLNNTSWSIAFGLFAGLGTVDIQASSTGNRVTDTNKSKNAIIPLGLNIVAGRNNLNLGVAAGFDLITGPNRSMWIYTGKPWIGIVLGLDVIK